MNDQPIDPVDGMHLLRAWLLHGRHVQQNIERVVRALIERANSHDDSKLLSDEFAGFTRINQAAREHPYGSPEYRNGMKQEKPTIDLHYSRNSHHPEFHGTEMEGRVSLDVEVVAQAMTWLDLIEMVCDWRGAYLAYGSQGTWDENMQRQRDRYKVNQWFTKEQWWLIEQIAAFVATMK